jgi:predicted DNA-binding WGR domain protein
MGTWDSGNFDNDQALDFLGELMDQLSGRIGEWFGSDSPDLADGEGEVIPALAVIQLLTQNCGAAPPKPEQLAAWKKRYLAIFDEQIQEYGGEPKFITARRQTIVNTFTGLESLSTTFWMGGATPGAAAKPVEAAVAASVQQPVTKSSSLAPPSYSRSAASSSKVRDEIDDDEEDDEDDDDDECDSHAKGSACGSSGSQARRFEFSDDKSNKFWEIQLEGKSFTVKYGRIGTAGQTQTKNWPTEDKCKKEYDKLVDEKLGKGYEEV